MEKRISFNKKEDLKPQAKEIFVKKDQDLVNVRACGRNMAASIGFSKNDQTLIAMALYEIGQNILQYAGAGKIKLQITYLERKEGIVITAMDDGPGIEDVDEALAEGFSTGKGMGIGLPAVQRIMDDFMINSEVGDGTTVKMSKWYKLV